ncbi:MAG: hypothetical protein ABI361_09665 [Nitrososphaera sp.]
MSAGNPDLRRQVEENRGPLKKLQLLIPGLNSYRRSEDIRVADELLRNQVADKLDLSRENLEGLRKQMANAGDFTNLSSVGSLIFQIQQFSGEVRHAQQGYSGLAASISIDEAKLNSLYEYDYEFVSSSISVLGSTSALVYDPSSPGNILAALSTISHNLSDLKRKWSIRMEAVSNIQLK